jgi:outer membrane lipoprotein-sorting protein/predicted small lipoprotein YifL
MKRIFLVITILLLTLSLMACGTNTPANEEAPATTGESTTEEQAPAATTAPALQETLSDKALLESLNGQLPDNYILEMVNTVNGSIDGSSSESMEMTIKTTVMGDYSIMEMSGPMYPTTMVMIYNPEEKMTYQYNVGEPMGMKFAADSGMSEMFETQENDMLIDDLEEIESTYGDNIIAREETYQGETVVYIETNDTMTGENATMKMWFSKAYLIPLKYELYSDGQLMMSSQVTSFDPNPTLTKKDFLPPDSINFQGFDFTPPTE